MLRFSMDWRRGHNFGLSIPWTCCGQHVTLPISELAAVEDTNFVRQRDYYCNQRGLLVTTGEYVTYIARINQHRWLLRIDLQATSIESSHILMSRSTTHLLDSFPSP